jgi:hypothetical protein
MGVCGWPSQARNERDAKEKADKEAAEKGDRARRAVIGDLSESP